ncbi:MAG: DUF1854 domain-containing protein [Ruminococcaceae bacterium]|nr:DUF1854 domain-containing protein [Oscillospiraceae bacterium]
MARNYIDGGVTFKRHGFVTVDMIAADGTVTEELEPRRLFPVNDMDNYISLLDADGKEHGIIRSLSSLDEDSRKLLCDILEEYYIVPKITEVIEVYEKGSVNRWTVMTDHGLCSFQIRARYTDIKILPNGRILIRDTNDNRYEIPDVTKLNKHSMHELNSQI